MVAHIKNILIFFLFDEKYFFFRGAPAVVDSTSHKNIY